MCEAHSAGLFLSAGPAFFAELFYQTKPPLSHACRGKEPKNTGDKTRKLREESKGLGWVIGQI